MSIITTASAADPFPVDSAAAAQRKPAVTLSEEHLAALYRENWSPLVRSAGWLLGDNSLAEEIVQDAFVRLVEHWDQIDDPAAAPAWLRRTTVNLSRSRIRRLIVGRRKRTLAASREPMADMSAGTMGDRLVDGPIGSAIRSLPRRQAECVVLRFVEDLTVDDIAASLGISVGSVKTHLHRGLKTLNVQLSPSAASAQTPGDA